jgi:hypothetical protein
MDRATMRVMTAEDFRAIALSLPEVTEQSHMHHPDFRVRGKIFATLGYPDENWAMVKLLPEQQHELLKSDPKTYASKGVWGSRGATLVKLKSAKKAPIRVALESAWRNAAPKSLKLS